MSYVIISPKPPNIRRHIFTIQTEVKKSTSYKRKGISSKPRASKRRRIDTEESSSDASQPPTEEIEETSMRDDEVNKEIVEEELDRVISEDIVTMFNAEINDLK